MSSSCIRFVGFRRLQKVCENQVWFSLIFADLLQVVETTCIKRVAETSWQSTCIKLVDNLQQACYNQAGANDANAILTSSLRQQGNKPAADLLQFASYCLCNIPLYSRVHSRNMIIGNCNSSVLLPTNFCVQ